MVAGREGEGKERGKVRGKQGKRGKGREKERVGKRGKREKESEGQYERGGKRGNGAIYRGPHRAQGVEVQHLPSCGLSADSWSARARRRSRTVAACQPAAGQSAPPPRARARWPWSGYWPSSPRSMSPPGKQTGGGGGRSM